MTHDELVIKTSSVNQWGKRYGNKRYTGRVNSTIIQIKNVKKLWTQNSNEANFLIREYESAMNTKILADYENHLAIPSTSKLIYPEQPIHDEFLETMHKIFTWSRWFGVVGSGNKLWKIWGAILLTMLFIIECGAIYKLVKLLAGLTLYSSGNRSLTARLAGVMFYTSSLMSLIISWRLSIKWKKLSNLWAHVEKTSNMVLRSTSTERLKPKMIFVICALAVCSAIEHVVSMMSSIELDCPRNLILEKYILESHGFIVIKSDFSTTLALFLLFMSNVATILWNFQDLLIVLISMGLTSRYQRLNATIAKLCDNEVKGAIIDSKIRIYKWRKIRDAFVKQAMLVRVVDECIGSLILLSSFGNFYFICLQLFLGITQGISGVLIKRVYYLVSMVWLCIRFSCMVLAAADINVNSRGALRYLFKSKTIYYNIEVHFGYEIVQVDRLQQQLTKDFVALSGLKFFYLDRTKLLQVAGAVITYELVLIQFDTKGFAPETSYNNYTLQQ